MSSRMMLGLAIMIAVTGFSLLKMNQSQVCNPMDGYNDGRLECEPSNGVLGWLIWVPGTAVGFVVGFVPRRQALVESMPADS